ncbi:MAG: XdhC family protein [Chloroflexia bacterium]
MSEVLRAFLDRLERNEPVALATVVDVQGASPAPLGARVLVCEDGSTVGTVGGGLLEQRVVEDALSALRERRSQLRRYALREDGPDAVGMLCGGEVQVFIEIHRPEPTLLLIGGGHVGRPLAEIARLVGFRAQVVDVDPSRGMPPAWEAFSVTPDTFIVIMTADASADEAALRWAVGQPAGYIGMIGSRRKVRLIFEHLRQQGISEELLARVHAPIGLDLGGRSPAEIALAVAAEMVAVRYGASGGMLSRKAQTGEGD